MEVLIIVHLEKLPTDRGGGGAAMRQSVEAEAPTA
jgi:hypothetical protein